MRRTLIQLDEETYQRLRREAFRRQRSLASLVREFVRNGLEPEAPARPRRLSSVAAGRSRQPGGTAPVSERHDVALTDAFEQ